MVLVLTLMQALTVMVTRLEGTLTSISVMETSSWGSTYSLMAYGGSWDLVDLSTDLSVVAATSDNESLCLPDGCYEISGTSGSGPSYPFGYSINGGAVVAPGAAGEAGGSDFVDLGGSCVTGCTDEALQTLMLRLTFLIIHFVSMH